MNLTTAYESNNLKEAAIKTASNIEFGVSSTSTSPSTTSTPTITAIPITVTTTTPNIPYFSICNSNSQCNSPFICDNTRCICNNGFAYSPSSKSCGKNIV